MHSKRARSVMAPTIVQHQRLQRLQLRHVAPAGAPFASLVLTATLASLLVVLLLQRTWVSAQEQDFDAGGYLENDADGNFHINVLNNRTVFVSGVDLLATISSLQKRIEQLETAAADPADLLANATFRALSRDAVGLAFFQQHCPVFQLPEHLSSMMISDMHFYDHDDDGDLDIFATAWNSSNRVDHYVVLHLENNLAQTRLPSENLWNVHVLGDYSNALQILVDDIDGDGYGDVVACSRDGEVDWMRWVDKKFNHSRIIPRATESTRLECISVTWDESDKADGSKHVIVSSHFGDRFVRMFDITSHSEWVEIPNGFINQTSTGQRYVISDVSDLDGDGDLDLLGINFNGKNLVWLQNDGTGKLANFLLFQAWFPITSLEFGPEEGPPPVGNKQLQSALWVDVNGDGIKDFVYAVGSRIGYLQTTVLQSSLESGASERIVEFQDVLITERLTNPSSNVSYARLRLGANSARSAADIDGDGDVDILFATAHSFDNNVFYWAENLLTSWAIHRIDAGSTQLGGISLADFDNDGAIDVVLNTGPLKMESGLVLYPGRLATGLCNPNRVVRDLSGNLYLSTAGRLGASVFVDGVNVSAANSALKDMQAVQDDPLRLFRNGTFASAARRSSGVQPFANTTVVPLVRLDNLEPYGPVIPKDFDDDGDVDMAGMAFQKNGSSGACVLYFLENVSNCSGQTRSSLDDSNPEQNDWIIHRMVLPGFVVAFMGTCHLHAYDLDGDHDTDIIVASRDIPGRFLIFDNQLSSLGSRDLSFKSLWQMYSQNVSQQLGIIDLCIGHIDLSTAAVPPDLILTFGGFGITSGRAQQFARLLPVVGAKPLRYRETFESSGNSILASMALPPGTRVKQVLDMNNDGKPDIGGINTDLARSRQQHFALICLQDEFKRGSFSSCERFPVEPPLGTYEPLPGTHSVTAVIWMDLNMDGLVDYVVSGREFVGWYEQVPSEKVDVGTMSFHFHYVLDRSVPMFTSPFDVVAIKPGDDLQTFTLRDLDHDGDIDLFVVSRDGGIFNYFVWCENMERETGNLTFVARRLVVGLNQISAIALGDIDDDGHDDLISSYTAGGSGVVRAVYGAPEISPSCRPDPCVV